MTTLHFPITGALDKDANIIIEALDTRSQQIHANSKSIVKKVANLALQTFALGAGVVAVASIPAALYLVAITPLSIGACSLAVSLTCLGLHILLEPRSPGERIVKEHWKHLFEALRYGNGEDIIESCQQLFKQKDLRNGPFKKCLGTLHPEEVNPFFHKTCLVGYLKVSLECLRMNDIDLAKSKARQALSHFEGSGYPDKIKQFITNIIDHPKRVLHLMNTHQTGHDLQSLDYLVSAAERPTLLTNKLL